MPDPKLLDDLSRRLAALFPAGAEGVQQDVEKNLKASLAAAFAKLDLVTREELDVQKAVLARTRARLAELERRLDALEGRKGPAAPAAEDPVD